MGIIWICEVTVSQAIKTITSFPHSKGTVRMTSDSLKGLYPHWQDLTQQSPEIKVQLTWNWVNGCLLLSNTGTRQPDLIPFSWQLNWNYLSFKNSAFCCVLILPVSKPVKKRKMCWPFCLKTEVFLSQYRGVE